MSEHLDPKMQRLHKLPLFSQADSKALEHLASATDEVTVGAGETLVRQGRLHTEAYIVESGTAEVLVDDEIVAEIPEGEIIGELSLFDRGPASATVRSKTEMSLLILPYNRVDQILEDNPRMVREVAKELARRLRAADKRLH